VDRDGSVEEIDEAGLFLVKNRANRNWNKEMSGVAGRFGELDGGE